MLGIQSGKTCFFTELQPLHGPTHKGKWRYRWALFTCGFSIHRFDVGHLLDLYWTTSTDLPDNDQKHLPVTSKRFSDVLESLPEVSERHFCFLQKMVMSRNPLMAPTRGFDYPWALFSVMGPGTHTHTLCRFRDQTVYVKIPKFKE